jgi:hypothetical protein
MEGIELLIVLIAIIIFLIGMKIGELKQKIKTMKKIKKWIL